MTARAGRSRLHALRLEHQAAALGRALLDDKREAILRALIDRSRRRAAAFATLREMGRRAHAAYRDARVAIGGRRVEAAALAQSLSTSVDWRPGSVVGVPTPRLVAQLTPFAPQYGAAATGEELDTVGVEFSAFTAAIIAFAEEDEAVRNLQTGLKRTVRRLKALEEVVIPRLDRERRDVTVALDEDERDDTVRRRHTGGSRRTSWPAPPNATR